MLILTGVIFFPKTALKRTTHLKSIGTYLFICKNVHGLENQLLLVFGKV